VPPARDHQVALPDPRCQPRRQALSTGASVDFATYRLPGLLAWPPRGEQLARVVGASLMEAV